MQHSPGNAELLTPEGGASDRTARSCSPLSTSGTGRGGLRLDSGVSGESLVTGLPASVCYTCDSLIIG